MYTTFRKAMVVLALGGAIGSSAPALAGDASVQTRGYDREYHVQISQQDLADTAHVQGLYKRIQRVVNKACRDVVSIRDLRGFSYCQQTLTDDAIAQADQPVLTALHEKSTTTRIASR
ncbi:MAG TPA: UrcA family protein [Alphaproteobacteria bacterium]|nr:UrcA family protein [Alphaproteobacteria bacterium]